MSKLYFYILMIGCVLSCQNQNKDRIGTIKAQKEVAINPVAAEEELFSALFDSVFYMPLYGGVFNELRKILTFDDYIYISSEMPAVLWRYNKDGILIDSLDRQGQGPGEYSNIRDFDIDEDGDIFILSRTEKRILIYDAQWEYKRQFSIPVFATAIHVLSGNKILLYCGNENILTRQQVILFDWKKEEILNGYFPVDQNQRKFLNLIDRKNFISSSKELIFTRGFDPTLYRFEKEEMQPWITIDFGKFSLPQEYLDDDYQNIMKFYEALRQTDYAFRIIGWCMSDKDVMFHYEKSNQFYLVILDRKNYKTRILNRMTDDVIFKGSTFENIVEFGPYTADQNGQFYFFINEGEMDFQGMEGEGSDDVSFGRKFNGTYLLKVGMNEFEEQ